MNYLVNDLSLHGQYPDIATFKEGIGRILNMRRLARQYGIDLYCHRNLNNAQVTSSFSLSQAVGQLSKDEGRAIMSWLTRTGPFWEDSRFHSGDQYLECSGSVVTDTAIGEAGYCCFIGNDSGVTSFSPSNWQHSPITVSWISDDSHKQVDVLNYWDTNLFETALKSSPPPIDSWQTLANSCADRFPNLIFSSTCFDSLGGHPFSESAMIRILELLDILSTLFGSRDASGKFNSDGQKLYQEHFVGQRAWFSDSSDSEKRDFKDELTFTRPDRPGSTLFCTWHGKIKTPQIRIHFSWPEKADDSTYIAYIGPKITKR